MSNFVQEYKSLTDPLAVMGSASSLATKKQFPSLQCYKHCKQRLDFIVVDKSKFIRELTSVDRAVFLRPRRFGKSLVLSMLRYFFYGATNLFLDTAVYGETFKVGDQFLWSPRDPTKHNFPPCPVIHLDFSDYQGGTAHSFNTTLIGELESIGHAEGVRNLVKSDDVGEVLEDLITKLKNHPLNKWKQVAVLVDEYDSPLNYISASDNRAEFAAVSAALRLFFTTVKKMDSDIVFAYVTGITSYGLAGLYSGANNFEDVSFDPRFNALCGFTEPEVSDLITQLCGAPPSESTLKTLKDKYNGYSWLKRTDSQLTLREKVYNPFLIGRYCKAMEYGSYWASTSSESLMTRFPQVGSVVLPMEISAALLGTPRPHIGPRDAADNDAVGRLMLEAGYATISRSTGTEITLDYPNSEIREFIKSDFLKTFLSISTKDTTFREHVRAILSGNGDIKALVELTNELTLSMSFDHAHKLSESSWVVQVRLLLWCMEAEFGVEQPNSLGRSDIVIFIGDTQYVLEFKVVRPAKTPRPKPGDTKPSEEGAHQTKPQITKKRKTQLEMETERKTQLENAARQALAQIESNRYDVSDLARNKGRSITRTVKIGLVVDMHDDARRIALMYVKNPNAEPGAEPEFIPI